MNSVFNAAENRASLERAYINYTRAGIKVRSLIITNPHNPLGCYYSTEALQDIARFCNKHNIHMISDEIYAHSTYSNEQFPNATTFNSILSLDLSEIIDQNLVHILYGISKDYGASGLRVGVLQSRNKNLTDAVSALKPPNSLLSWPSFMVQNIWARVLEDTAFLQYFFHTYSERLTKSYSHVRDYMEDHGIEYFRGTNAGLFVWARILPYPDDNGTDEYSKLKERFLEICLGNGVNIADGDS
ncbi:hypothetical protein ANOM_002929, partial [Aspergillus nomiae NRRL 13137]